ncbi:MAG: PAS domain S-box protein [Bacteroidetes bacterium]|nr:PAS domain S-box protein [Bacteroidota bacterium]
MKKKVAKKSQTRPLQKKSSKLSISELRYKTLTETAPVGIFRTDAFGFTTYVNPKWTEIAGISGEEALGNGWHKAVHPEDYERICCPWLQIAQQGEISTAEYRFLHSDGSVRWVLGKAVPEKDPKGNVLGYIGTITDITELRLNEELLHRREEQFQTLFMNMIEGVALHELIYDDSGNPIDYIILECNPSFERILNIPVSNVKGRRATKVYKVSSAPYLDEYSEVVSTKQGKILEKFFPAMEKYFLISVFPWNKNGFATIFQDITSKKQTEKALQESEKRYRTLFENAIEGIFRISVTGEFLDVNPAAARIFGFSTPSEFIQEIKNLRTQLFLSSAKLDEVLSLLSSQSTLENYKMELRRKDNKKVWVNVKAQGIRDSEGNILYYEGSIEDITEQRFLEEQLREAQKMESIGTLAGGIAHDFNNILGIILGYVTLMRRSDFSREKIQEYLDVIEKNIDRGASLVRQILTFARKSVVDLQPLDVNEALNELVTMLTQTFPKTITISLNLEKPVPILSIDRTQFDQVLLNLCVNARDAMGERGTLTLATKVVSGMELAHRDPFIHNKTFLRVSVHDTGSGISPEIKDKIFEPFFTTKGRTKGTGLGLSVVYGVVKSLDGYIEVFSSKGKGATFHLYFPVSDGNNTQEVSVEEPADENPAPQGNEVILLVEDEKEFRTITKQILESAGYTVLSANDGKVALQILEVNADRINLLLTDIGLPELSGKELSEIVKKKYPEIKLLFTSGFIDQENKIEPFVGKPFTPLQLLRKVRSVLDS